MPSNLYLRIVLVLCITTYSNCSKITYNLEWQRINPKISVSQLVPVPCIGAGRILYPGQIEGFPQFVTSTDGIKWDVVVDTTLQNLSSIGRLACAYGKQGFVIVTFSDYDPRPILTSKDGLSWNTIPVNYTFTSVIYYNEKYVALISSYPDTNKYLVSTDTKDWKLVNTSLNSFDFEFLVGAMINGTGQFLAYSDELIYMSQDIVQWSLLTNLTEALQTHPKGKGLQISSTDVILVEGGKLIAAGLLLEDDSTFILSSNDYGKSVQDVFFYKDAVRFINLDYSEVDNIYYGGFSAFTDSYHPIFSHTNNLSLWDFLLDVEIAPQKFEDMWVGVGYSRGNIKNSKDRTHWEQIDNGITDYITGLTFQQNNNLLTVATETTGLFTSTDLGKTFTNIKSNSTLFFKYFPDISMYGAIVSDNTFAMGKSPNEMTLLSDIPNIESTYVTGIEYGNGIFVATSNIKHFGTYSGLWYTSEAYKWQWQGKFGEFSGIEGLIFINGTFVAYTYYQILTSTNGEKWTIVASFDVVEECYLTSTGPAGSQIAWYSCPQKTLFSMDGITWTPDKTLSSSLIFSASFISSTQTYVLGLYNGTTLMSTDRITWLSTGCWETCTPVTVALGGYIGSKPFSMVASQISSGIWVSQ